MNPLLLLAGVLGLLGLTMTMTDKPSNPADPAPFDPQPEIDGEANMRAMLRVIQWAEGTYSEDDPYRVTYGYADPLTDLTVNPWETGQVQTVAGPDGPTTAAGAYQIVFSSWKDYVRATGADANDFSPAAQDAYALWAIERKRKVGDDVRAGNLTRALNRLSWEWASLPPARYSQHVRSMDEVLAKFAQFGGKAVA